MFLLTVFLSKPWLLIAFNDVSTPALSWIATLSACVVYAFLFGVPSSFGGFAAMFILSIGASAIPLSKRLSQTDTERGRTSVYTTPG